MNKSNFINTSFFLIVITILSGCNDSSNNNQSNIPIDITRDHVCMLDGMILLDHPGPKGQIILKNNEHQFFCDTKGLISTLYNPNYKTKIKHAFVQDFGNRQWGSYKDNWIDITKSFLVIDSHKVGSMGPTPATFSTNQEAENFAKQFGGSVIAFNAFTTDQFEAYQKRIRNSIRKNVNHVSAFNDTTTHKHN